MSKSMLFVSVAASKCLSKYQPTVPEHVTMATAQWVRGPCFFFFCQPVLTRNAIQPQLFRDKWTSLSYQRYVASILPPAQSLTTSFSPTTATPAANSLLHSWVQRIAGLTNGPVSLTTTWAARCCIFDLALWSRMMILRRSSYTVNSQSIGKISVASSLGLAILLRIRSSFQMGPPVLSSKVATFINCRRRGIQKRESLCCFVFFCSPTSQNVRFPADKCTASNQPTAPSSIVNISPSWVTFLDVILRGYKSDYSTQPPLFRKKWTSISLQRYVFKMTAVIIMHALTTRVPFIQ